MSITLTLRSKQNCQKKKNENVEIKVEYCLYKRKHTLVDCFGKKKKKTFVPYGEKTFLQLFLSWKLEIRP